MKTKTIKRALSMALALVLALSMMVVPVSAAVTNSSPYAGGSGIETDPYLLSSTEQLVTALTTETEEVIYFKLTDDIILDSDIDVSSGINAEIDMNQRAVGGNYTITVSDNAVLNIVSSGNAGGMRANIDIEGGILTLRDIVFEGSVTINGGNLTIFGCTFYGSVISGGTLDVGETNFEGYTEINGGIWTLGDYYFHPESVCITGGAFSTDMPVDNLADGYVFTKRGNWYIVSMFTLGTTYAVIYDTNGGTGTVIDFSSYETDEMATVLSGDGLTYTGYEFIGWNTAADGSGTPYMAGDTLTISGDVTLYAQWEEEVTTTTFHIYNSMILSSSLAFTFLIDQKDLNDATGYTLTITKTTFINGEANTETTKLSLVNGEDYDTYFTGYWIVNYDEFYVYEYESTLTAVLSDEYGNVIQTEQSYNSVGEYLNGVSTSSNSSNAKTMASAALTYCQAAKTYYEASAAATVNP